MFLWNIAAGASLQCYSGKPVLDCRGVRVSLQVCIWMMIRSSNPISCGPADETNELPVCLLVFGGPPRRTNLRWWFLIHQQIPPFFVEKEIWTDQWGAYKHTLNFIPSYLWYPNNIFLSAWLSAAISPQLHRRQRSSLAPSLTTSEFNSHVA